MIVFEPTFAPIQTTPFPDRNNIHGPQAGRDRGVPPPSRILPPVSIPSPSTTLDPDAYLDTAPPEYLRSLFQGARWKLITYIGSAACGMVGALLFIVFFLSIGLRSTTTVYIFFPLLAIVGITLFALAILQYVALFRFTAPDPRGIWHEPFEKFRRILRLMLWLSIAFTALAAVIGLVALLVMGRDRFVAPGAVALRVGLQGLGLLWGIAFLVVEMMYIRFLGERMRDLWLINHAKLLVWLLPLLSLLFCTGIAPLVALGLQMHLFYQLQRRLKLRLDAASASSGPMPPFPS